MTAALAVAIPARNEAALLPRCLDAIGRQRRIDIDRIAVVVLANNCTDATADIARAAGLNGMAVKCVETRLPPERANAGWARRLAVDEAARLVAEHGIVVTTDADGVADEDWLAAHSRAFAAGVDAVAGRVSGDWSEMQALPAQALAIGDLEWRYQAAVAELESLIDPVFYDPWPRHWQRSGANIALTRRMLDAVGGVPPLPVGEDNALLQAVERAGGRVRHAPEPHVMVSARRDGRARGGMADALAARAAGQAVVDTDLERPDSLLRRLELRAALRRAAAEGRLTSTLKGLGLPVPPKLFPSFPAIWAWLVDTVPALQPAMVDGETIAAELARLETLLAVQRVDG
jgi:hypothetical protein